MSKFKKYIILLSWVSFYTAVVLVLGAVKTEYNSLPVKTPIVKINTTKNMHFLNKSDILRRLEKAHLLWENQVVEEVGIEKIEREILEMSEVASAKVFFDLEGTFNIECVLKTPIARVIDTAGNSFYIDSKMGIMPISRKYTARVTPVTGIFSIVITSKFPKTEATRASKTKLCASWGISRRTGTWQA